MFSLIHICIIVCVSTNNPNLKNLELDCGNLARVGRAHGEHAETWGDCAGGTTTNRKANKTKQRHRQRNGTDTYISSVWDSSVCVWSSCRNRSGVFSSAGAECWRLSLQRFITLFPQSNSQKRSNGALHYITSGLVYIVADGEWSHTWKCKWTDSEWG